MNNYRKTAIFLSALIFCLMCGATAIAQAQKQDSTQTLKIDTTLVSVPVVVSDRQGRYVSGLK
ncbi:MAG: hypothetical protein J2P41_22155, partial [Blastocatellia bacterium]|nr:hypothetical protein [Blastocatellia bacterium]